MMATAVPVSEFALHSTSSKPASAVEIVPSNNEESTAARIFDERDVRLAPLQGPPPTDSEDWERFESEYAPLGDATSPFKQEIESAKYDLDTIVFAVDHLAKSIENHVDFGFDQGTLRPTREISPRDSHNNPRVKLDLNIGEDNKPCYAGVRLIIPFGN